MNFKGILTAIGVLLSGSVFAQQKDTIKIKDYTFNYSSSLKVRYVKLIAKKLGELPTWHLGYPYDGRSWLFIDEIQIK